MTTVETQVLSIDRIEHAGGYRLRIHFADRSVRDVDFGEFLRRSTHPEVRKYLEMNNFLAFHLVDGDLMWGDFDLIFPIASLYQGSIE
jgi:hypothetical protein